MTAAELDTIRRVVARPVLSSEVRPYASRGRGRIALEIEWPVHVYRHPGPRRITVRVLRYGRTWQVWRDGRIVEHGRFGADVEADAARVLQVVRHAAGERVGDQARPDAADPLCTCGHRRGEHYVSDVWPACSGCLGCRFFRDVAPPPRLGWHETRRGWNAAGQCAREACRAELPDPAPVHRDNGLSYCHACEALINRTNGMVLVAVPSPDGRT